MELAVIAYLFSSLNLNFITFFVTIVFIVVLKPAISRLYRTRGKNVPPGPTGIPFLGYAPFLTSKPHLKLQQLAEQYGDVFTINLVGEDLVVLNSFEAIKEAFLIRGTQFSGVPQGIRSNNWLTDGSGIFQEEGQVWQTNRRFLLHVFKDFGIGSQAMELKVESVAEDLVKTVKSKAGLPFNAATLMNNCAANVLFSVMFNKQYDQRDPEFRKILESAMTFTRELNGAQAVLAEGPMFYFLPVYWKLRPVKSTLTGIVRKFIREHRGSIKEGIMRDYMDAYLQKKRQLEEDHNSNADFFSEEQLIGNGVDLLIAGMETTACTMTWILYLLTIHPEMQERIRAEIDAVAGKGQLPRWDQRSRMPFLEAFTMEVYRYTSIVPIAPLHSAIEESTIRGYTIPQRTSIITNIWAIHRNPKHWKDPNKFDPTRFLDSNGGVIKNERVIPFLIGKRSCVGESLARMELFIFTTTLIQQFVFRPPEGTDLTNLKDFTGVLRYVEPHEICAMPLT